jgi:hypothetical protein
VKRGNQVLLAVGIALWWSGQASALLMDDSGFLGSESYIDFESGFPEGGFASQEFGDVTFASPSGADTLAILDLGQGGSLVEITGRIEISFGNGTGHIGFDYQAGSPVYLEAYDAAGNLLNPGDTGGVTGVGYLGFQSNTPIASVVIHDTGLTFRVDNLGYDGGVNGSLAAVPEPGAALLFSVGLTTAFGALRRKHTLR